MPEGPTKLYAGNDGGGVPLPDTEKLSLLTKRVAVRFPVLLGAKPIEKLTVAPWFRVAGRPGSADREKIALGAPRLMLERVAGVVPVFWIEKVKLSVLPTASGVKSTAPLGRTVTAVEPLV